MRSLVVMLDSWTALKLLQLGVELCANPSSIAWLNLVTLKRPNSRRDVSFPLPLVRLGCDTEPTKS